MIKLITCIFFVLILVSACNSSPSTTVSEQINACSIISASEFEKLVAVKAEATTGENNECIYSSLKDATGIQYFLFITKFTSEDIASQKLIERINAFKGVGKLPFEVEKLADGASFFCDGVLASCTLIARIDQHLIEITSLGQTEEIANAAHKQLVTFLLTKI